MLTLPKTKAALHFVVSIHHHHKRPCWKEEFSQKNKKKTCVIIYSLWNCSKPACYYL